ncbi:hypothetical protein MNV84_05313 [Leishmania braziliensis]|nr:hypothetical protein MNV84_05313 [Leishmania braziliensis]
MGSDAPFLALASTAIENEIRTYFPYMALYRRLCRGGWERAVDYLYREFAPGLTGPADDGMVSTPDSVAGVAASSAGVSLSQPKRRRKGLVEELQRGLEEFTAATFSLAQPRRSGTVPSGKQSEVPESAAAAVPSTTVEAGTELYTVTCRRCITHVTSTYPCWVLKGYVVLWAESVLEVECVAAREVVAASSLASSVAAEPAHGNTNRKDLLSQVEHSGVMDFPDSQAPNAPRPPLSPLFCTSLPPMGVCPLLHQLTSAFTGTLDCSAEGATASFTPLSAATTATAAPSCRQQGPISSSGTLPCAFTFSMAPVTQTVRLHSLNIVNSDAVSNTRPGSFVLQSILQPGWQTALECYPRHMVHFGLLVYAAWHASAQTWESVLLSGRACKGAHGTAENPHTGVLPSRRNQSGTALLHKSRKRAASPTPEVAVAKAVLSPAPEAGEEVHPALLTELIPHTAHDAVLILGLGGNVLGQCLDALLPATVPLHIVEVEPAVLQACYEHGQFPAIDAVDGWRGELDAVRSCKTSKPASASHKRNTSSLSSEEAAETAPAATSAARPTASLDIAAVMQWAAGLIRRRSATPAVLRATGQSSLGLLEGLAAPPPAVPCSAKCAPRFRRTSAAVTEAVLRSQRGRREYVCFLQDAYAYLRAGAASPITSTTSRGTAHPVAPSSPQQATPTKSAAHPRTPSAKREATNAATVEAAPTPTQYSMIFLDCYDPDREHMMHEGALVELCARRLKPGGVLLVNAHVLPTLENLRCDFLGYGFATVQALRVAGCTQTVVVCVAHDTTADRAPAVAERPTRSTACAPTLTEKRGRFTLRQIQLLANALNRALRLAGGSSSSVTGSGDDTGRAEASAAAATGTTPVSSSFSCTTFLPHSVTPGFWFDAAWLKSCRRVATPPIKAARSSCEELASTTSSQACFIDVDLRVWEHHF